MIWIKRISPFVIIGLLFVAYHLYTSAVEKREQDLQDRYALITAQVWVASAVYRESPNLFRAYRDSLLTANNVTTDSIEGFIASYQSTPEQLTPFTKTVKELVDSLIDVADSLKQAGDTTQTQ